MECRLLVTRHRACYGTTAMKTSVVRGLIGAAVAGGIGGLLYRVTSMFQGNDLTVCIAATLVAAVAGGVAFASAPIPQDE